MAVSQSLYEELAKALGQPSKAYRAASAALAIPGQGIEGYRSGAKLGDEIRERDEKKRKDALAQKPLREALGNNLPHGLEGFGDTTVEAAGELSRPITAIAALDKSIRDGENKPQKYQQGSFLVDGKLTRFDPISGQYEYADQPGVAVSTRGKKVVPLDGSAPQSSSAITGTPAITPRIPPALPAEQINRNAELSNILNDIDVVRKTKNKEMVGPVNNVLTNLKQKTGYGASGDAAIFKSTVSGMRNKVLNLLSGAAISPDEARRLMAQLPNESSSNVDFDAKLSNFERETQNILAGRNQGFQGAGFRGVQGNNAPAVQAQAPSGFRSFASEEEAEKSGYKGPAVINGRKAVIH